ncbi:Prestin [Fasciolopsis buskii]|uniref:Prestin n=1 Tax=Fasciolopsis buskii TaxID=27845 RepID=A0A8E0VKB3_9TREM|nr:Prestin [Fasciolopsis buski]
MDRTWLSVNRCLFQAILDDLVTNMTRLANGSDLPDSTAVRVRYAAALSMTVGLLQTYYAIIRAIRTANGVTIGLSAMCILIIVVVKTWINPRVVKRIRVPIPIDLIIVSSFRFE